MYCDSVHGHGPGERSTGTGRPSSDSADSRRAEQEMPALTTKAARVED
jgi:hypothetical protein